MTKADAIQPMVRFLKDDGQSVLAEFHWMGPWPPPDEFRVYVGVQTGVASVMPGDEPFREAEQEAIASDLIDAFIFRQTSCSRFSDEDMAEMNEKGVPVMRGAQYEKESVLDGDSLVR